VQFRLRDNEFYMFVVSDAQGFELSVYSQNKWRNLIDWTPSAAIRPGDWNRLAVKAVGPSIVLYINDRQVASASDETILEGQVGVKINLEAVGHATVEFDNLEVRTAPAGVELTPLPAAITTVRAAAAPATMGASISASAPGCPPTLQVAPADWHLLMCETFANNAAGWEEWTVPYDGGTADARIAGGSYHWDLDVKRGLLHTAEVPTLGVLTDQYVAVDTRVTSTAGIDIWQGLVFRAHWNRSGYQFLVSGKKGFSLT
jgi:hypothetical protein